MGKHCLKMIHLLSHQNARAFGRSAYFLRTSFCYSFSIFLILSLLLSNVQARGSNTTETSAAETMGNLVTCNSKSGKCELQIYAQKDRVDEMVLSAKSLFKIYKTKNMTVDEDGLNQLLVDVGLIRERFVDGHAHAEHHKDEHDDHADEDHTRKRRSESEHREECHLIEEIQEKYTNGNGNLELTFDSFLTILPQLLMDRVQNEACFFTTDHHEEEQKEEVSTTKVWLIALGSVLAISLLSIIGLLTVPLMKFSKFYNRFMAGLIALAVGTLVADAILHLLPHAASDASDSHDHSTHEHDAEKIYKHLMVVVGIYGFYLFETLMNLYRIRKVKMRRKQETLQENDVAKRLAQDDVSQAIVYTGNGSGEVLTSNSENNLRKLQDGDELEMGLHHHHHGEGAVDHKHQCSHSHPPEHLIKDGGDNTIMDMAWMVIAGDGLHNFSDGLAIGAAFSSTIAAGLSTSFAIFFHELPHELGDFAVLIKAGMSITQALTYNIICAGLAIIGTIIGLLIGEYTTNFKMWVLALTAGGFLYVALVDMLPGLIKISCDETDRWKFVIVQIGLLSGIAVMLVIALYEGSFQTMFE